MMDDDALLAILRKEEAAASNYQWSALSRTREERWAREASEYVPHVFMRENDGFRILYWLIKDALMYRLGAVTVDTEDFCDKRRIPVQSLPQDAINLVA